MANSNEPMTTEDLNHILKARRDKLAELQAADNDPFFITKYDVEKHSADIKDNFEELDGKSVKIAGRLMSKRVMGKYANSKINMIFLYSLAGIVTLLNIWLLFESV